jgi:DNA-binding XRE family transcriptional regulator
MTPAEEYASKRQRAARHRKPKRNTVWLCLLREYRDRIGLTLDDVADALKMSKTAIHQIENGQDTMLTTARAVAKFFGVAVESMWPALAEHKKEVNNATV